MGDSFSKPQETVDSMADCCSFINCCLKPEEDSERLSNFLSDYEHISLYKDPYYGDCHVLERKEDNYRIVLLRESSPDMPSHVTRTKQLQDIGTCAQGPANRNIIKTNIVTSLQKTSFLWTKQQIYLSCDFILFDLEKEFDNRMNNHKQFSQAQIRTIIRESTKGFLRLQLTNYSSVRMKHIYFCNDGLSIKLAHPKLFNYSSNLSVIRQDYNTKNIYLSPEEMNAFEKSEDYFQCGWAQNAFSLGMIMLSLMTMKHLNYLYNYQSCEIYHDRAKELIKLIKDKYSYHLLSIVQSLLHPIDTQRLNFRTLHNRIDNMSMLAGPVDLTLLNDHSTATPTPIQTQAQPKYTNYISAFIKPKVGMAGQFIRLPQDQQQNKTRFVDSVVANSRLRYVNQRNQQSGAYMGSVSRPQNLQNKEIREGQGLYQYQDGQCYIGQWHLGKMWGYGKLYFSDKRLRYQGQFKNGNFDGNGTQYSQRQMPEREKEIDEQYVKIYPFNWIKYEGNYVQDKRCGAGKIYFKNGYWRGNFRDGQPNGEGIFLSYVTNKTTKGVWQDGELVSTL